jgi:hypothetical protein
VEVTEGKCETILEIMASFLDGYSKLKNAQSMYKERFTNNGQKNHRTA